MYNQNRHPRYKLSALEPHELTERTISAWADLEARAIEANAFLSPHYVLPSLKYLEDQNKIFIMLVEKVARGSSTLVGVCVLKICKPQKIFPLTHLRAFCTIHSPLSGMLVDKDHASDVLTLLFNHFSQLWQKNWHGIFFEKRAADGPLAELEKHISNEFGMKWHSSQEWERGILHLEDCGDSNFENLSKNIRKNINRRLRRLGEMGDVQWNVLRGNKLTSKNINQFIKLEHMGWKGEQGTSLYSNPKHLKFFQEVIDGFNREGRAFFAELQLNGNVISSTSNLISGNVGFAIKIGWDPAYSKFSPGVLNEAKWLQHGDKMFKELEFLDSGASENSYINDIWIKKRSLKSGIYTITDIGKLSLRGIHLVKSLKKKISRPA